MSQTPLTHLQVHPCPICKHLISRARLLCSECAEPNYERIAAGESWSRKELVTPKDGTAA